MKRHNLIRGFFFKISARLRDSVLRKRPELWGNQTCKPNNAPAHASLFTRSYLAKHQISVVPHPPHSPDLAPGVSFVFPKLKTNLKGRRFQTIEEIQEEAITELRAITESAFPEAFRQLKNHWERCIASTGDYLEEESA
jgi:transposase